MHAELLRVAAQCTPPDVARFPVLQTVLAEAVEEFISLGAAPAEAMLRNLVSCELAYINTSHPQFIGGNRAIAQVLEQRGAAAAAAGAGAGGNGGAVADASGGLRGRSAPNVAATAAAAQQAQQAATATAAAQQAQRAGSSGLASAMAPEDSGPSMGGSASATPRPGLAGIPMEGPAKGSWFAQWFGHRAGGHGTEGGARDEVAAQDALHWPPSVRGARG